MLQIAELTVKLCTDFANADFIIPRKIFYISYILQKVN